MSDSLYTPSFMINREEFEKDKANVLTEDDWYRFDKKWFETDHWPVLHAPQYHSALPKHVKGWERFALLYAITPEARHEFLYTLHTLGNIRFDLSGITEWHYYCGYDQIYTANPNAQACPLCSYPLYKTPQI